MNYFPEPDFPFMVVAIYPQELHRESILQDNLRHLKIRLKDYVETGDRLESEKRILNAMNFTSQMETQKQIIAKLEKHLIQCENELSKGLAPYKWRCVRNIDEYDTYGIRIKAEYGMFLVKQSGE